MTINEFLFRLGQTPRTWAIRHNGSIRSQDGWHTPVSAVNVLLGGKDSRSLSYYDGLGIGLSREDAEKIEWATDSREFCFLRERLLIACGLELQAKLEAANHYMKAMLAIYDSRDSQESEGACIVRHQARVFLEKGRSCDCKQCDPGTAFQKEKEGMTAAPWGNRGLKQ